MEYKEAILLVEEKRYLIGKKVKGETIDEIIICPTNPNHFKSFETIYNETLSADYAIAPFEKDDVEVGVVIGKKRLKEGWLILWKTLNWAQNNLD